jgi:hypothetical protein
LKHSTPFSKKSYRTREDKGARAGHKELAHKDKKESFLILRLFKTGSRI